MGLLIIIQTPLICLICSEPIHSIDFFVKNNRLNINPKRNGKPFEKMGRKADGLKTFIVYGGRVTEVGLLLLPA